MIPDQKEVNIPEPIQARGCNLLCLAAIPQVETGRYLAASSMIPLFALWKEWGYTNNNCDIVGEAAPYAITRSVFHEIGRGDLRCVEVGEMIRGTLNLYGWVNRNGWDFAIGWTRNYRGIDHKILFDWRLAEVYNPTRWEGYYPPDRFILYQIWPAEEAEKDRG